MDLKHQQRLRHVAALWVAGVVLFGGWLDVQSSARAGEPWDAAEMDWPYWRGPEMNGVSREKNLPNEWSPDGKNLLWKREDLASRSTPVVMDGLLYTLVSDQPGTRKEAEKVVCVDAATGEPKWESRFNVFLSDVPDTRVGWSSVVADPESKKVFALGVCGYFLCLDAKTGKILWDHSLSEEYGLLSTYGGRTNLPITYKNLVIISAVVIGWGEMAKPMHRFMAFDQRNGELVWFEGTKPLPDDTTYSAPVLASFNGQAALVFASGDGTVDAFQPETGQSIWSYDASARGINVTPLVVGNQVVCGHSEENLDSTKMGALFCLDGSKTGNITKTGVLWRHQELLVGKSSPLHADGKIFAAEDTGTLHCVDLETGKLLQQQKLGGSMRSSPIYVDGKIYLLTENGRWWVLKPTEAGFEIVTRARLRVGESYGSPIVSHGRMYVPTTLGLYCIAQEDAEPAADPRPKPPAIKPMEDDQTPALVQVVPAEALLKPGDRQPLQIRLYNKNGEYVGLAKELGKKVELTVAGVGRIGADQAYSAPAEAVTDGATITAKIDDLQGQARIRVVPPLPWSYNFDNGEIPEPWVGIRYRHVPLDFDLLQKLKKADPLAGELYIYLMTTFINNASPAAKFDDSTARKAWTDFVDFLKIQDSGKTVEAAQAKLDPVLEILKQEQVVSTWKWNTWSKESGGVKLGGVEFLVNRGPRKIDGNGVMAKITTIPKGTRSQGSMGPVDLANYTIESDVYAANKDGRLPDVGLIAQRYTLDLMGASQQLQLRTWHSQLRMAKTVPFAWKVDTWYTLKLQASVEDEKAVLRGKVWEKGGDEPKEWTVEATDESPNLTGSPGAFGNATEAEVFYDNLKVYFNESQGN